MAETPSLRQTIKGMADAIRAKGISGQMSLLQMPNKIGDISTGEMYGLSMDCLLGDVDSDGVLQKPSVSFTFTSNDIKILPDYGLYERFYKNTGITSLSLPNLTQVNQQGMLGLCNGCSNLTSVDLSSLSSATGSNAISNAFSGCTALQEVKFNNATAVPAISANTFNNTNSTFKIIVPDALYSQWIVATNWSALASQIVKVSEYTPAS